MFSRNFTVEMNKKNPVDYVCGEVIRLTVHYSEFLKDSVREIPCPRYSWVLAGDDGKKQSGVASDVLTLETTLDRPGFIRLTLTVLREDGSPDPDVPVDVIGAGAEIEKLAFHGEIPADFDAYWQGIREKVSVHEVQVLSDEPVTANVPDWCECRDIRLSTPEGRPVSGFLTMPKGTDKLRCILNFTSYGVVPAIPLFKKDAIVFSVNAHGFENLPREELAKRYPELAGYGFNAKENQRPETTYWQNMILRDLVGAKWLKTHPRWDKKHLVSFGGSQGAFQAVTVAAQDPDITFLEIFVPAFADLSAEQFGFLPGWRPKPTVGMRYFDTAAQASRVTCPVTVTANLGDTICPPNTTVALYNTFRVEKKLSLLQVGMHTRFSPTPETAVSFAHDREGRPLTVENGTYRHYKGDLVQVIAVAAHSESEKPMVVYEHKGRIWARPLSMWNDRLFYQGELVRRFTRVEKE